MFGEMAERADGAAVRFIEHAAPARCGDRRRERVACRQPRALGTVSRALAYMGDAARRALASPADQVGFPCV